MGRPIKKKFFGNLNTGGVGGETIASIAVGGAPGTGWTTGTVVTISSSTQITGGSTATGITVVTGATLSGITIVNPGSGFTTSTGLTFTFTNGGTLGSATFTPTLTTTTTNAIVASAITVSAGSAKVADIINQKASHRYRVATPDGIAVCKLVAAAPAAVGEMSIIATDSYGSTYYVTKLTSRKALLTRFTLNGTWEYANGSQTKWALTDAVIGTVTITHTI